VCEMVCIFLCLREEGMGMILIKIKRVEWKL